MRNTWLVIQREYLERIRSKAFIIMTLLMPVFMASTVLIPASLSSMQPRVTRRLVLVASSSGIAEAVKQQLAAETPHYSVEIDTNTSDAERDKLRRKFLRAKSMVSSGCPTPMGPIVGWFTARRT